MTITSSPSPASPTPRPAPTIPPHSDPALWVDTHCHLTDDQFDADREAVLERAVEAGVGAVIVVADSFESSAAALHLAEAHTFVVPASAGKPFTESSAPVKPQDRFPAEAGTTNAAPAQAGTTNASPAQAGTTNAFPAKAGTTNVPAAESNGEDVVSAFSSAAAARRSFPRLVATAGVHPHNASAWDADPVAATATLRALCARGAVAVGEVGLDFHYDFSPRPAQVRAFSEQGALALELSLPLVMHCREAWPEFRAVLLGEGLARAGGVVHCFAGTPDEALELVEMGFFIGIGGAVTFKRNDVGRDVARALPLESLLLETDAPYLAPVPLRGRRNEPALMVHSARCVAEVRGMTLEDLARATRANALRLFPGLGCSSPPVD